MPILGFAILGNFNLALQIIAILLIFPQVILKYMLAHDSNDKVSFELKVIMISFSFIFALLGFFLSPIIISEFFEQHVPVISAIQLMSFAVMPRTISLIY